MTSVTEALITESEKRTHIVYSLICMTSYDAISTFQKNIMKTTFNSFLG